VVSVNAAFILNAIRRHHAGAAIVPEVTITDDYWLDYFDIPGKAAPTRRIDALMWESRQITAIEIKVSVADFDRDIWQKRLPWQRVSHRFVYAVPAGMLDGRRDVAYGCGLWEVSGDGTVKSTQRCKTNQTPEPLPLSVIQNLAYRAARATAEPPPVPVQASLIEAP
jgi:hypothetical protein